MGLDMWLYKKDDTQPNGISEEPVMYWRKANQIRYWIVTHCPNVSEDENITLELTQEQLRQLQSDIEVVMANFEKAPEILPTQAGFFFGTTEYDETYFLDLINTYKALHDILQSLKPNENVMYHEWW